MIRGSQPSLEEHFEASYGELVEWCRRRISPYVEEPEDLVHGAYLRCRARWRSASQSAEHAAAYLYRSLRWEALDALRRYRRDRTRRAAYCRALSSTASPDPSHVLMATEALDRLPPRQRQACVGILAGKSARQVAADMEVSPAAVAVMLTRARKSLQRTIAAK
jgi:RNA polymerase sigma factor (sigma-70 family)